MADVLLREAHKAVKAEEWVKAWHLLNRALNEDSERGECLFLMGHVLRQQGNPGIALPLLAKALAKEQKVMNVWMSYGACLHDLNRWDEAIKAFHVAMKLSPFDDMPHANIAGSLVQMGRWRDAIMAADEALKIKPDNYIAMIAKTFGSLGLGRWEDAWKHADYLYGNHLDIRVYNDKENEEPTWDGTKGQTVVVQCDQGLGDIIMFSQCIPMLQADCKDVILETVPRLAPLLARTYPGTIVYPTIKEVGMEWPKQHKIDAHIHISHLPKFYLNKDPDFPRKPYLKPNQKMVEYWLEMLEKHPKPWIGVAWQGGIPATMKHLRSIELKEYAPILAKKGTFVDMSYHNSKAEVARWNIKNKKQIVYPSIKEDDYDATVSLASVLDDVVTVTTTLAHVRGALGMKAKVLVPEVPTWRYAYRTPDDSMMWYPKNSVRLYRKKPGETGWKHAINRVADDL
jgi:tetratricopeptide (TPR) repeat protein